MHLRLSAMHQLIRKTFCCFLFVLATAIFSISEINGTQNRQSVGTFSVYYIYSPNFLWFSSTSTVVSYSRKEKGPCCLAACSFKRSFCS